MFLAFVGNDTMSSRTALQATLSRLQDEMPGASLVKLDEQSFTIEGAVDAMAGGNLFAPKNIIIFDDILSHPNGESFYLKNKIESEHVILVREMSPKKAVLTKIQSYGEVQTFTLKKPEESINAFALGDAVMMKDKKNAWVEFEKSRRRGEKMEAIHGMLFWVFKTLTEVSTLPKSEVLAAGIKNFTYNRGLSGMEKYRREEVYRYFDELKDMYHRAHRGECDLEYSLEQFLLKL